MTSHPQSPVLADSRLSEAEVRLKTRLANKVALIAEARGLDASDVARETGLPVEKVAPVLETDHDHVSTFDLMAMLIALGVDISITATTAPAGQDANLHLDLGDTA